MAEDDSKSLDMLGIKPVADSINIVTKASVQGASSFLSRICLPAAEEFGLLLQDKISNWRLNNQIRMLQKSEKKYSKFPKQGTYAHPRLVSSVLNYSSWSDDDTIHDMWAGLLASSCTPDGKDESNLIFINILSQITSLQAKIINHCCESAKKKVSRGGWIISESFFLELDELIKVTEISDFHRLDRELDHLRSLELIERGFMSDSTLADLTPTSLALQMYTRCQGYFGSPLDYFGIENEKPSS